MRNLLFMFLTIAVSSIALAQKHLPSELVEAKKVYLRNESSEQKMFDKIYELIQKWGRWEIVEKKKDADLELVLEVARRTTQRSAGGKEYTYLVAKNKDGDEIYKAETRITMLGSGTRATILVDNYRKALESNKKDK